MLRDCYRYSVLDGENFFSGKYFKKFRSKETNKKRFQILEIDVYVMPDEIFESFVGTGDNAAMYN